MDDRGKKFEIYLWCFEHERGMEDFAIKVNC